MDNLKERIEAAFRDVAEYGKYHEREYAVTLPACESVAFNLIEAETEQLRSSLAEREATIEQHKTRLHACIKNLESAILKDVRDRNIHPIAAMDLTNAFDTIEAYVLADAPSPVPSPQQGDDTATEEVKL